MADKVTNDLILKHMQAMHADISPLKADISDIKFSVTGIREHLNAYQAAISLPSDIAGV